MKRETGRFLVEDSRGRPVKVIEFKEFLDGGVFAAHGQVEGIKSYQTADGRPLNRLSEDEFQVRLTQEVLRRI